MENNFDKTKGKERGGKGAISFFFIQLFLLFSMREYFILKSRLFKIQGTCKKKKTSLISFSYVNKVFFFNIVFFYFCYTSDKCYKQSSSKHFIHHEALVGSLLFCFFFLISFLQLKNACLLATIAKATLHCTTVPFFVIPEIIK